MLVSYQERLSLEMFKSSVGEMFIKALLKSLDVVLS